MDKPTEFYIVHSSREKDFEQFLSEKHNTLSLKYPGPSEVSDSAFMQFFESPFRVERRKCSYQGVLAVDVSSYIGFEDSPRLEELATYMSDNPDASYVLYAIVGSVSESVVLARRLGSLTECEKYCFKDLKNHALSEKTVRSYGY